MHRRHSQFEPYLGPLRDDGQPRRSFHTPQNSTGGLSNASDETRVGDDYPELFQDFEKTRSITSLTALAPNLNRAKFEPPVDVHEVVETQPTQEDAAISRPKLPFRQRLRHFTWAWYTLSMSTGGLALLVVSQPHTFPGLRQIGFAIYIINIILFLLITSLLIARFFLHPGTFKSSITHRREGFFFPCFFLSIATLITGAHRYAVADKTDLSGVPTTLLWAIEIAFWAYLVLTTLVAIGQYLYVFSAHKLPLSTMMPTWILPIFPIMLSGTIASVIAGTQPSAQAISIITAGLTCQGLGIAVATMMYAHMMGRLISSGLPHREHRPGLFMCVGPPSFTALAFVGLAKSLPPEFDFDGDGFLDNTEINTMAIIGAGFLWALSFWWFGIAVAAVVISPPKDFHLGWWASVFPNVGFVLATLALGREFQNEAVLWFGTAISILMLCVYLFVGANLVKAVWKQEIVYPGRDEDVEDH
ncbi:voltage-dependent anion channel-domain-containing protein [Cercophora newfieldiana]|uniref:Voltage-dependent anion channel-domain-containing protein n=1 Tax=Cercophora newfieldiana TaxID=92897 RepID=A0AA40CIR1_9PEZI|nr:voltage-dependent anion channel-domain-containing protein [Cercophora newfieldiana]